MCRCPCRRAIVGENDRLHDPGDSTSSGALDWQCAYCGPGDGRELFGAGTVASPGGHAGYHGADVGGKRLDVGVGRNVAIGYTARRRPRIAASDSPRRSVSRGSFTIRQPGGRSPAV